MRNARLVICLLFVSASLALAQQPRRVYTNRDFPTTPADDAQGQGPSETNQVLRTRPSPRQSWHAISRNYFADGNQIRMGQVLQLRRQSDHASLEPFDVASFKPLDCGFVADQTGVYSDKLGSTEVTEHNEVDGENYRVDVLDRVDVVDQNSFSITKQSITGCEAKDRNFRYRTRGYASGIMSGPYRFEIVQAIGAEEFEPLNCNFARTSKGIFWMDQILRNADPGTFQALVGRRGACGFGFYAKDKSHVYYQSRVLRGADPESFQVLDTVWSYYYAFDKNSRYEQGIKIPPDAEDRNKAFEEAYRKWKRNQ